MNDSDIPVYDVSGVGQKCYNWRPQSAQEIVKELAKSRTPGLVNFVAAVAYHFYLALPAAFSQPGEHL